MISRKSLPRTPTRYLSPFFYPVTSSDKTNTDISLTVLFLVVIRIFLWLFGHCVWGRLFLTLI